MAFTYSGDPSSSDKDSVRFEIQDTNSSAPLLQDAEVQWAILNEAGQAASTTSAVLAAQNPQAFYSACARCCEVLARLFAAQADTQVGSLKTTYKDQAKNYAQRAEELREKASSFGAPYVGGQSLSEKQGFQDNPDLPQPMFARDAWTIPYGGERQDSNLDDLADPITE